MEENSPSKNLNNINSKIDDWTRKVCEEASARHLNRRKRRVKVSGKFWKVISFLSSAWAGVLVGVPVRPPC